METNLSGYQSQYDTNKGFTYGKGQYDFELIFLWLGFWI